MGRIFSILASYIMSVSYIFFYNFHIDISFLENVSKETVTSFIVRSFQMQDFPSFPLLSSLASATLREKITSYKYIRKIYKFTIR